ncbi:MAG: CoA-binding protein [uncultured Aureispira sp.]|uniref:CoA-binding protein n=1 Tax=uncultured Aureispira sp. TaxID=1331704 RepID=A0A6S6S076_9BACT|nr:MAG: CoA-binding protein [uncultured Aureispira sp.]
MSDYKTIVLGATTNPVRYAYLATQRLLDSNIEVIPVGIRKGAAAGIPIRNDLPMIEEVHTITLYLNASVQKDYYDYILSLKPKRVIFNPGTENTELYGILKQALPETKVEAACTLVLLSIDTYKS